MPTQSTTYNSRVTDEALEKRFRDTFRSQGGAELVDDLYAQGVIVPIVDFTAAATGQQLAQNLQTAWDFSTGTTTENNSSSTIISNAGFWQIDLTVSTEVRNGGSNDARIYITNGLSNKVIWRVNTPSGVTNTSTVATDGKFVAFVRSGDSIVASSSNVETTLSCWYRQIATVSGDLIDPTGFTSS